MREASGENFRFSPLPVPIIATDSDDLTLKQREQKKSAPWGGFLSLSKKPVIARPVRRLAAAIRFCIKRLFHSPFDELATVGC